MSLHSVRGPTLFDEIKTINGHLCNTYWESCGKLGLLEEDHSHWDSTLIAATLLSVPSKIRSLFAIISITCTPSDPQCNKYQISIEITYLTYCFLY